jgi:DNA-binding transcriptional MerR regulator
MNKAAGAFRTISEVAEELGVPKHVLRFWEIKFAHIRPMKRGGGRRFYRPEDMDLLLGVRDLLHRDGYTIKGVQKILREQGVDAVKQRGKHRPAGGATSVRAKAGSSPPGRSRKPASEPNAAPARPLQGDLRKQVLAAIAELKACKDLLESGVASAKPRRRVASA